MRNISASLTKGQIRQSVENVRAGKAPVKDVTRRLGWLNLKPGERLQVCEKCQGLKPGEKLMKICVIEVVSVRREPLSAMTKDRQYGEREVRREGFTYVAQFGREIVDKHFGTVLFPWNSVPRPEQFVKFFCLSHKGCAPDTVVTRIEFKYVV